MIATPAIDLMDGRCVQLRGGVPEDERVSLPDPVAVAHRWWNAGFTQLHIVDLDAALDRGDNRDLIRELVHATPASTQVGGGLRSTEAVRDVLDGGADRAIVGTRAVDDPEWLALLARGFPERVMLAADVRERRVLRRGWTESAGVTVAEFLAPTGELPLAGVLCTDVAREGRLQGIDPSVGEHVVKSSPHPVWMSGGISTLDDLHVLHQAGAAGAVLGMSLYTDAIDPDEVAREFGS